MTNESYHIRPNQDRITEAIRLTGLAYRCIEGLPRPHVQNERLREVEDQLLTVVAALSMILTAPTYRDDAEADP